MSSESDPPFGQPAEPRPHAAPLAALPAPADPQAHPSPTHEPQRGHRGKKPFYRERRFWVLWVPIIAILLIGGCVLLRGPKKAKGPPGGAAIPVAVAQVRSGTIDVILNALGTVTPVYTVTVTSRVSGQITQVLYQEGQRVKANDLLLVIDPRPYAAAATQAEGQRARDQALLENARIDLGRYENAFKTHAIAEQQLATQQALVKEDEGTVQVDQGNLDAANLNVEYTQIRSPIDGQVGLRPIDPGNLVVAGGATPLATITQLQPITVIFTVAEDDLGEIVPEMHPGHPLRVDAFDRTQQKRLAQGTLDTLDNQIATATGTVRARASFANAKLELFPNQFVNVKLYVKTLTGVNLVPTAAIQRNDTAAFVYVVQPNQTVKSQPITITVTEGDVAAATGVQPGDTLVTDGFDKLQDGSKVAVRQPGARPPAPPSGGS